MTDTMHKVFFLFFFICICICKKEDTYLYFVCTMGGKKWLLPGIVGYCSKVKNRSWWSVIYANVLIMLQHFCLIFLMYGGGRRGGGRRWRWRPPSRKALRGWSLQVKIEIIYGSWKKMYMAKLWTDYRFTFLNTIHVMTTVCLSARITGTPKFLNHLV